MKDAFRTFPFFLWPYGCLPSEVLCLLESGVLWSFASSPISLMAANDKHSRWPHVLRIELRAITPTRPVCVQASTWNKKKANLIIKWRCLIVNWQSCFSLKQAAKRVQLCCCLCRLITKQSLLDYRHASFVFVLFFYIVWRNTSVWVAGMRILCSLAWLITLITSNPTLASSVLGA